MIRLEETANPTTEKDSTPTSVSLPAQILLRPYLMGFLSRDPINDYICKNTPLKRNVKKIVTNAV